MEKLSLKGKTFKYGNYYGYYGYRNKGEGFDTRIAAFEEIKAIFLDKDVLDIGCNIGHITYTIGRDFHPKSIYGLDIDPHLIQTAKKNVVHYMSKRAPIMRQKRKWKEETDDAQNEDIHSATIPVQKKSFEKPFVKFPKNVTFIRGNYVLKDERQISLDREEYDVILCLSVMKWIHLNWGDDGVKKTFKRMFKQLRPGGKLILEYQLWNSYKKKKNLTDKMKQNYAGIKMLPENFEEFLLSQVGFESCQNLILPQHTPRGFRRPIKIFTKSG